MSMPAAISAAPAVPARPRLNPGVTRRLRAAGTGVIVGAWGAALLGQRNALAAHEWSVAPGPLIAALVCAGVFWICLGLGWWQALRSVGGSLAAGAAFRVWVSSLLWRYLPGNVWHIAGRVYLGGQTGERRSAVLAASVVEQFLTLAGACLVILLCLPAWPEGRWLAAPTALGLAGSFLLLHPATGPRALRRLGRWTGRPVTLTPPSLARLLTVLSWCATAHVGGGLSLWFVAAGLGAPADPWPVVGAGAAAWAIGYLSLLTPGGLGVREGALAVLLAPVIGAPAAILAGILSRIVSVLAEAAVWGGVRSLPYLRDRLYSKKSGWRDSQTT